MAKKGVLHIPQNSRFTGASPSDCLMSYVGHSFSESHSSAEMPLVYSTAPADRAEKIWKWSTENMKMINKKSEWPYQS